MKVVEHYIDRWNRLGIKYKILSEDENGMWVGKHWRQAHYHKNPTTWLNTCCLCKKISTPKKVCSRHDVYGWNDPFNVHEQMLCTSCWNKVRAIVNREREANEIKRLTNKLKREISKWQKSPRQES